MQESVNADTIPGKYMCRRYLYLESLFKIEDRMRVGDTLKLKGEE